MKRSKLIDLIYLVNPKAPNSLVGVRDKDALAAILEHEIAHSVLAQRAGVHLSQRRLALEVVSATKRDGLEGFGRITTLVSMMPLLAADPAVLDWMSRNSATIVAVVNNPER